MKVTKGNLRRLVRVDMEVTSCRVSSPYEQQYWTCLRDSNLLDHHPIEASAYCLDLLTHRKSSKMHFTFWFRLPCVLSERERAGASPSKQCVEELHRGSAASEEQKVPELTLGESQSPGETVSDDRLAMTPGSPSASSPGHPRTSTLSMVKELEDRIVGLEDEDSRKRSQIYELENEDMQKHRRIRALAREVDTLEAEALALAAQQQRQAVLLKQKDEQISELQAKLLEKDNEIGHLRDLNQRFSDCGLERLQQVEELCQQYRESLHLPGISAEDEASESDHEFPEIPDSTVDEASESSHGWPAAIPEPTVGESAHWSAPPSDQGIEMEPLDEAWGVPDETYHPDEEASETAHDYDTTIGSNAFAEPPTSSPPRLTANNDEQFNTDWAAECHNLKKMKRSAKSKRRQQKKLTEKD